MLIWGILHFLLIPKLTFSPKSLASRVLKGLFFAGAVALVAQALVAFWVFPFNSYTSLANRGGFNTRSLEQIQQESLRLPTLLGFGISGEEQYRYDYFFFAAPVVIFFFIGTITAFLFKNKKMQILAILSVFFVLLTTVPVYLPFIAGMFTYFFTAVYFRGLIPAFILIPLVAAWGVWSLPYGILLLPFHYLASKFQKRQKFYAQVAYAVLYVAVVIVALGIAYWSINKFQHTPVQNNPLKKHYAAYGPTLTDDYKQLLLDPQAYLSKLHKPTVNPDGLGGTTMILDSLNKNLNLDNKTIIDVSPYAAGGAVMQGIGLIDTNVRTTNLYHYYASLIHGMWGYQAGEFYGKDKLYKSPVPLGDLTDWFGLKYVLIVPNFDPFNKYIANGWKQLTKYSNTTRNWGFEVWENPNPTNLYSATKRPVILAIGDFDKGFFDHVFRSANLGALPYKDAWIVQGSKNIDDYSLEDLKQFRGIILQGYSYHFWDKGGAWGMIQQYVEQGGNVFVDTGWQYVAKDWGSPNGSINTPGPLPVSKVDWSNIGTTWEGTEINPDFAQNIDLTKFDPPVWDGNPWGMSLSDSQSLRDGAKSILSKDGKVIIAEQKIGNGTILWSGMNLLSHVTYKMNDYEAAFVGQLFKPLFADSTADDYTNIAFTRDNPDNVRFTLGDSSDTPTWLLFRESYAPYWHANLISNNTTTPLHIYSAGPGFVLMRIPKINAGDSINLTVSLGLKDGIFAVILSIITAIALFLFIPFGRFLAPLWNKVSNIRLTRHVKNKVKTQIKTLSDEEDY
jgi:hypothetical protein